MDSGWIKNPAAGAHSCRGAGLIPGPAQWLGHCHSFGVGYSCSSDSVPSLENSMCLGVAIKKKKSFKLILKITFE